MTHSRYVDLLCGFSCHILSNKRLSCPGFVVLSRSLTNVADPRMGFLPEGWWPCPLPSVASQHTSFPPPIRQIFERSIIYHARHISHHRSFCSTAAVIPPISPMPASGNGYWPHKEARRMIDTIGVSSPPTSVIPFWHRPPLVSGYFPSRTWLVIESFKT